MPLFFILSGMCFVPYKYSTAEFIKKRTKQLLLPSAYLTLLFIAISLLSAKGFDFYGLKNGLPGALWFLPVLYFTEIIYCLLYKLPQRKRLISICLIGFGGGYLATCQIENFYSLETIPTSIVFYELGHSLKQYNYCSTGATRMSLKLLFLLFLLMPFLRLLLCSEIFMMCVNNIKWYDFLFATLTTIGVIQLSKEFERCKFSAILIWLGKNTMMIMAVHLAIMNVCGSLRSEVPYVVFKLLEQFFMWGVSVCLCILANRYVPWLVGKKKKRN